MGWGQHLLLLGQGMGWGQLLLLLGLGMGWGQLLLVGLGMEQLLLLGRGKVMWGQLPLLLLLGKMRATPVRWRRKQRMTGEVPPRCLHRPAGPNECRWRTVAGAGSGKQHPP